MANAAAGCPWRSSCKSPRTRILLIGTSRAHSCALLAFGSLVLRIVLTIRKDWDYPSFCCVITFIFRLYFIPVLLFIVFVVHNSLYILNCSLS